MTLIELSKIVNDLMRDPTNHDVEVVYDDGIDVLTVNRVDVCSAVDDIDEDTDETYIVLSK